MKKGSLSPFCLCTTPGVAAKPRQHSETDGFHPIARDWKRKTSKGINNPLVPLQPPLFERLALGKRWPILTVRSSIPPLLCHWATNPSPTFSVATRRLIQAEFQPTIIVLPPSCWQTRRIFPVLDSALFGNRSTKDREEHEEFGI